MCEARGKQIAKSIDESDSSRRAALWTMLEPDFLLIMEWGHA
jgi:hypothetical protein